VQANVFRYVSEACKESANCLDVMVWGVDDDDSWIQRQVRFCPSGPCDAPVLFYGPGQFGGRRAYQPKPAWRAVRSVLT
jgi:GH35 family endo-1,4-beta-xylanase